MVLVKPRIKTLSRTYSLSDQVIQLFSSLALVIEVGRDTDHQDFTVSTDHAQERDITEYHETVSEKLVGKE
jgi:hypothetical protein